MRLNSKDLPQDVQEQLVVILNKEERELIPEEIAFLRARTPYLNDKHKARFSNVLGKDTVIEEKKEEIQTESTPTAPYTETIDDDDEDEDE